MDSGPTIPQRMKAIRYVSVGKFELTEIPVPVPQTGEVLIKVRSCGICGTDLHIHDGEFPITYPVVTGHETSGEVVQLGSGVQNLAIGDRVTADSTSFCQHCHFCREGMHLQCDNLNGRGTTLNGGFAEYCIFPASHLFRFTRLSWTEASLFEAAACAVHGMDRLRPRTGSTVLQLGSGPTGLCLSQLLKVNGAAQVTLASNAGKKMELAKALHAADEFVEFDATKPQAAWEELRASHPRGFDIVVEATGDVAVLEKAFDLCSKGGTLLVYGVYPPSARMNISPSRIFLEEITILGSFSEMNCLPRAVNYLESGKVDVTGVVTHTFPLERFGDALEAIRTKASIKAVIVMD